MIATTDNFAQQLDRFSERLLAGFRLLLVVGLTATLGLTGNVHHEHEFMISLVGLSAIAALSLLFGYVLDVRWWTPWFLGTLDVALLIHCLWLVSTDVANSNYTTLAVPGTSLIFVYLAMAAIRNRPFLVLYTGTLFIAGWLLVWLGAAPSDRFIAAHPDTMWSTGEIARIAIVAMVAGVLFLAAFQSRRLIGTLVSEVQLRARFAQYLPAPVAMALANGEDVLEAHNREVAVLFVDIRRFTRMAEAINPGDVAELLTTYRHRVSRCVTIHGGYVDKFIGDGLMAVFGAPLQGAQDARNALDCGFSILEDIAAWNLERSVQAREAVDVTVAIHFGPVVAGVLGHDTQLEYTVIGDTVNVAARIEELAGQLEATLIVSEELLAAARVTPDGEAWRPLLNMALRGRQKPINIYMINETAGPTTGLAPKSRQAANSVYARSTRGMLRDATSHEQAMRS